MEAVLKVRVQGIFMPWKEMMQGCLVMVMLGILCLFIQNYAENGGTVQEVPVCGAAGSWSVAALEEAGLSKICRDRKLTAADMRGELTDFPGDLSAAVKPVPVRDIPAKNLAEMENPQIIVRDDPPVMDVTDLPGDNLIPVESVTPGDNIVPVESEISRDDVIPGESEIPGDDVIPGESEIPGDTGISEEPVVPEEIAGFILDSEGYITGYTERVMINDNLLLIPKAESCLGIRKGAFEGLGEEILEVYIPATICDIESGAFDGFPYLMFVEVSEENSCYYSVDGILYSALGKEVFCPAGRETE